MSGIDEQDFINELIFCIKQEDVVKAKALLQFASDSDVSVAVQQQALAELAKGPEKVVYPLLEYLTKIDISNPDIQESLYDLILDKAFGNARLVIEYITNNEKKTRLLFIRACGDLLLQDAAPVLQRMLTEEKDKDIIAEVIKTLGKFRGTDNLPLFARMASLPDKSLAQAAIYAISETGGNDAVDLLIGLIGEDEENNKLIVESLAEIQDIYALNKLTTLLSSERTNVRDTAIDHLIQMGYKATPILTQAFQNAEADYLVHLVTTLGYIGDPAAVNPIIDIVNTMPEDPNIRQAAYEAMERIPSAKTAICLVQGLQDTVETVRMSAARAIDKNLSKALVAGLKNVVREGSQDSKNAVGSLIDAEAASIFNFLVGEESFIALAEEHVTAKADPQTRESFLKQMGSLGQKEFAQRVAEKVPAASAGSKSAVAGSGIQVFVVDDSKMMLKLYLNKLTALGYSAQTFERPEDAIPRIIKEKPALVITDLNMPNISGLELTREVRQKHNRNDLPILMITTQSDFIPEKEGGVRVDDAILKKSGINQVLHKPFTDEAFKKAVDTFIGAS